MQPPSTAELYVGTSEFSATAFTLIQQHCNTLYNQILDQYSQLPIIGGYQSDSDRQWAAKLRVSDSEQRQRLIGLCGLPAYRRSKEDILWIQGVLTELHTPLLSRLPEKMVVSESIVSIISVISIASIVNAVSIAGIRMR